MKYRNPGPGNAQVGSKLIAPGDDLDMPEGVGEEFGLVPSSPAKPKAPKVVKRLVRKPTED